MDTYYSKDKKESCTNSIAELVERIAKSQRGVCSTCVEPISCDMCFYGSRFNTIPIRLTSCCSATPIEGLIGAGGPATAYFRIECISNKRYVKLRLLSATVVEGVVVLSGTNYTIVVDLECVGSIQCFEPINITVETNTV